MKRISRVRRSLGLSHMEFGRALDMPAWQMEVAERGVMFCRNRDEAELVKCFFTDREFEELIAKVSGAYAVPMDWLCHGRGYVALDEANAPEDELAFYFPVTVSGRSMMEDLKAFKDTFMPDRATGKEGWKIERDEADWMMTKYRLYARCLNQIGKAATARKTGKQLLTLCGK